MTEALSVHGIGIECEFLIHLDVTSIREEQLNKYDDVAKIPKGMKILVPLSKLSIATINSGVLDELWSYLTSSDFRVAISEINYDEEVTSLILNFQSKIDKRRTKIDNMMRMRGTVTFDNLMDLVTLYNEIITLDDDDIKIDYNDYYLIFIKSVKSMNDEFQKHIFNHYRTIPEILKRNITYESFVNLDDIVYEDESFICFDGFEVKTSDPRVKVEEAIEEIKTLRNGILIKFQEAFGPFLSDYIFFGDEPSNYPYVMSLFDIRIDIGKVCHEYFGSYHLNITLPLPDDVRLQTFQQVHVQMMKAIQLIEPLLLAVFTAPMLGSFNDDHEYFESGFRLIFAYGNMLTTHIHQDMYYTCGKQLEDRYHLICPLLREVYQKLPFPPSMKEALYTITGADFRINSDLYKPDRRPDGLFGFEFRMLDLFRLDDLYHIIIFLYMLAEYLKSAGINITESIIDIFQTDELHDSISNQIVGIINEGWNAPIEPTYRRIITSLLNIPIPDTAVNCYDVLEVLSRYVQRECEILLHEGRLQYLPHVIYSYPTKFAMPNPNKRMYEIFLKFQVPDIDTITRELTRVEEGTELTKDIFTERIREKFNMQVGERYTIDEDIDDLYQYAKTLSGGYPRSIYLTTKPYK